MKYAQLNSDVFTGTVTADWVQAIEEYRHDKQVAGVVEVSLYEEGLTVRQRTVWADLICRYCAIKIEKLIVTCTSGISKHHNSLEALALYPNSDQKWVIPSVRIVEI